MNTVSGAVLISPAARSAKVLVGLWLVAVFSIAAGGGFSRPSGELPFPILLAVALPLIVFLSLYRASPDFRRFALGLDLPLITALHAWRFLGFGFLALRAHDLLPGYFAWPAALGDLAMALSAPWMAMALVRDPAFAHSRLFRFWNLFGLADFAVALGTGIVGSGAFSGGSLAVNTASMARLPLVLIPAFLVPLFILLHLAALARARSMARPVG